MSKTALQLVDEAEDQIRTLSVEQALALFADDDTQFVDLRDIRELKREGTIPGAVHAPRGMLEFWVDPTCRYNREVLASCKHFVFYCAMGWRSALATKTVQDMGLSPVSHIEGGFNAWKDAGGAVQAKE